MEKKLNYKNFSKIFLKEDVNTVLQEYEDFRWNAIINKEEFKKLRDELLTHREYFTSDEWKKMVFASLDKIVDLFADGSIENRERKKKLVDEIELILLDTKEKITSLINYKNEPKAKFFVLILILDVIYSFSDERFKIKNSAIIYDMMREMNDYDGEFKEFYGESAKKYFLTHTFENLLIASEEDINICSEKIDHAKQNKSQSEFVGTFCKELEMELEKFTRNLDKSKKYNKDNKRITNWQIFRSLLFISLCIALVGTMIFCWGLNEKLKKKTKELNEKTEELAEKEKEIDDISEQLQQMKSDNQNMLKENNQLKNQIESYKNEITNSKTDEYNKINEGIEEETGEQQLNSLQVIDGQSMEKTSLKNLELDTYTIDKIIMEVNRNVRSERNQESESLGTIQKGDSVTVNSDDIEEGWIEIQYDEDKIGYVYIRPVE